jgi:hypothetical protein
MVDNASMPGCLTVTLRSLGATGVFASLVVMATVSSPTSAAAAGGLADAFSPRHASCHAGVSDPVEMPARAERRVKTIALERTALNVAAERKWAALEQFDDTPVVSATLRVRFRGESIAHSAHSAQLACTRSGENSLVCTNPACAGGEVRITGEGLGRISLTIGGTLKNGSFIGHHIHLDESCEGRAGGPLVLESGDDNRRFSLAPAPKEACR